MDCAICADGFNHSTRQKVTCFSCSFDACKACVRRYLMTATKPQCMNCAAQFPYSFMVAKLNRSFMETYRPVMEQSLVSSELGLIAETMPYAEAEKERRRLEQVNQEYFRRIETLEAQRRRYLRAIQANRHLMRGEEVPDRLRNDLVTGAAVVVDTKKQFIMACPGAECKGFLSTAYKCSLCDRPWCSDCLALKAEGHACVESDRLSAELIKRETRPCPTCGERIYKTQGCDQMFCTNPTAGGVCGTAFSWKTGAIETGTIHNPHFYELQRQNGVVLRNVGDVQCGGIPQLTGVLETFRRIKDLSFADAPVFTELRVQLINLHRNLAEHVAYTVNDLRHRVRLVGDYRKLRIRYILQDINPEDFKRTLYKNHKEQQKLTDMYHLMELVSISAIEAFIDICTTVPPTHALGAYLLRASCLDLVDAVRARVETLHQIRAYVNAQLKELSVTYNCTVQIFDAEFKKVSKKYNISGAECK